MPSNCHEHQFSADSISANAEKYLGELFAIGRRAARNARFASGSRSFRRAAVCWCRLPVRHLSLSLFAWRFSVRSPPRSRGGAPVCVRLVRSGECLLILVPSAMLATGSRADSILLPHKKNTDFSSVLFQSPRARASERCTKAITRSVVCFLHFRRRLASLCLVNSTQKISGFLFIIKPRAVMNVCIRFVLSANQYYSQIYQADRIPSIVVYHFVQI